MSVTQQQIDNVDVDRLNDKDKDELRQFLANQQQRANLQAQTHHLTSVCWSKCVTGTVKNPKLDKNEEGCLTNCVGRFLDMNMMTMKYLQSMGGGSS